MDTQREYPNTRSGGQRPGHRPGTRSSSSKSSSVRKHRSLNETKLAGHSYKGRSSFTPATVEAVKQKTKKKTGNGHTLYWCPYLKDYFPFSQMQIDHIVPWEAYGLSGAGGTNQDGQVDQASMARAYNDVSNLQLIYQKANASKGQGRKPKKNLLSRLQS